MEQSSFYYWLKKKSCTDDNANAHQYDACPPDTKKLKRSSEIE